MYCVAKCMESPVYFGIGELLESSWEEGEEEAIWFCKKEELLACIQWIESTKVNT